MKILFLDIDGVLNRDSTKNLSVSRPMFIGLDPFLLNKFKTWLNRQPEVKVVMSSTWRQDEEMFKEVVDSGIPIIDRTPLLPNKIRGEEISLWLSKHKADKIKFAILDDNRDMLPWQLPMFVQTSPIHGLRDKDLTKIEAILNL